MMPAPPRSPRSIRPAARCGAQIRPRSTHASAERLPQWKRQSPRCSSTRAQQARPAHQSSLRSESASGGAVIVEIAAPEASATGVIDRARLDTLLDTALRDRRGDFSLVLAGAVADALGGAVYFASDAKRGLVLELQLVACPPEAYLSRTSRTASASLDGT